MKYLLSIMIFFCCGSICCAYMPDDKQGKSALNSQKIEMWSEGKKTKDKDEKVSGEKSKEGKGFQPGEKKQTLNNKIILAQKITGYSNELNRKKNRISKSSHRSASIGKFERKEILNRYSNQELDGGFSKGVKEGERRKELQIKYEESQREQSYAYYLNVTKRYGWFVGVGKQLTEQEIKHIRTYYKLSNKDVDGHWTILQAYNAYGKLTVDHSVGTYLVNPHVDYDEFVNKDMLERLKSVCQWVLISDEKNKKVAQEYGLDSEFNIIYCYAPQKINGRANTYTGSFTDGNGMPIIMRTDSLGNKDGQANYVQVALDKNGYDSLLCFTDEKGNLQKNKDGAYMTRKLFDRNGFQIREASLNLFGKQIDDVCGNCGWENTYDNYGCMITAHYFDANDMPVKMPGTRGENMVYGYEFEYDKYHRETARYYLDDKYQRCQNERGVYKTIQEYDDRGNMILFKHLDKEGCMVDGQTDGTAMGVREFDNKGNLTRTVQYDKLGNLYNSIDMDTLCESTFSYFPNGKLHKQIDYALVNGRKHVVFDYISDLLGNTIKKWYKDNLVRVDSVDSNGRNTLVAFYDLEGNPQKKFGYHRDETKRFDSARVGGYYEKWTDVDGGYSFPNEDYYTSIFVQTDSVKQETMNMRKFGKFVKSNYILRESDDFTQIDSQWELTPYGCHARVGWDDVLYYKANVSYNTNGKMYSLVGENEFGELAYITGLDDNPDVYCYTTKEKNKTIFYNENGSEIDSMSVFVNQLPKAMCIEITDTATAYPLGLQNGDVVLTYGKWVADDCLQDVSGFYLETITKAKENKKMLVLRHYPSIKTSEIVSVELPAGTPSELGFYAHKIYYTEKEKNRLLTVAKAFGLSLMPLKKHTPNAVMLVPVKRGLLSSKPYWLYDVQNPSLVLLALDKRKLEDEEILPYIDRWDVTESVVKWQEKAMFANSFSGYKTLYFTDNLESVNTHTINQVGNQGMEIVPIFISDTVRVKAMELMQDSLIANNYLFKYNTEEKGKLEVTNFIREIAKLNNNYGIVLEKNSKNWKDICIKNQKAKKIKQFAIWSFDNSMNYKLRELLASYDFYGYQELQKDVLGLGNVQMQSGRIKVKDGNEYLTEFLLIDGQFVMIGTGQIDVRDAREIVPKLLTCSYQKRDSLYVESVQIEVIDNGFFRENGIEGKALLLQYENWNFGDDLEKLGKIIEESKEKERLITFVPFEESDGKITMGVKRSLKTTAGMLGLHFTSRYFPVQCISK